MERWHCLSPDCKCQLNRDRYLADDEVGATELVRTLTPMVKMIVETCLRYSPREEQEDVQQVVFMKMFRKLSQWRGNRPFCLWVRMIAINTAITHGKLLTRRKSAESPLSADIADPRTDDLSAAFWECIERTYDQLTPEKQRVYDLVTEGVSYEKTSKLVGKAVGTIYNWMRDIRLRILPCTEILRK